MIKLKALDIHCEGCGAAILEGQEILELTDCNGETIMIHQDSDCTYQYVAGMAYHKVAGE